MRGIPQCVAWLIRYTENGTVKCALQIQQSIEEYREIDPLATITPIYEDDEDLIKYMKKALKAIAGTIQDVDEACEILEAISEKVKAEEKL